MTDLTYLRGRMVHALVFNVACRRTHSRGSQRRFFAQMRRALAANGYAMSHWRGLCVIVPLHEQELRTDKRKELLGALLDGVAPELIRRIAAGAVTQCLRRLQRPRHGELSSRSSAALV